MVVSSGTHEHLSYDELGSYGSREDFQYAGRMWIENKVISFWDYPHNKTQFESCLEDIEEAVGNLIYITNITVDRLVDKVNVNSKFRFLFENGESTIQLLVENFLGGSFVLSITEGMEGWTFRISGKNGWIECVYRSFNDLDFSNGSGECRNSNGDKLFDFGRAQS